METRLSINKVIRTLTVSDIMVFASLSMLGPILPIFVISTLPGGSIQAVGVAIGIQWIVRAVCELPIAYYFDHHAGERDDYTGLVCGSFIVAVVPFLFLYVSSTTHVYLLQALSGFGFALNHPSWTAIFSRHAEPNRMAWNWGMYGVAYALGVGIAGILSGYLAACTATARSSLPSAPPRSLGLPTSFQFAGACLRYR